MTFDEMIERCQDYHRRPDHYRQRNKDIVSMARVRGGQRKAAKKYGLTDQRVSQIVQASSASTWQCEL